MRSTTTDPRSNGLTHALVYEHGKWSCRCGYVLGRDGHEALYAQCPDAYIEFNISKPPKEKPKVVGILCGGFGAKQVTEQDLELFKTKRVRGKAVARKQPTRKET
jgi:hypothetical protein